MNYKLIMTEGTDELTFLNVLLEKKILKFKESELLANKIFHERQIIGELLSFILMLPPGDTITIYRVGDKLSDNLKMPKQIMNGKIVEVIDISTTPEFEILFLINEDSFEEYTNKGAKEKKYLLQKT